MRVAVLGQGSIGRRHAGLLRELGADVLTFDPVAPADTDDESSAVDGADAVVVASPSARHEEQALRAIRAGLPTLVEKPLALDAWGAARVRRAAERAGVPVGVAMNLRHHPGVRGVRDALPRIGTPLRAAVWCGSWLPGWRPGTDYRQSYSAQAALGGGVALDAIHEIDELTWILGPVASVSALLPKVSDLELDVEDVALLQLELASGVPATVTLDYLDRAYHRGCRVVGADGTIAWEWGSEEVHVHADAGPPDVVSAPADAAATYREQLAEMVRRLAGGEGVGGASAREGEHALRVVDAARASAATGRRVQVGLALRAATEEDSGRILAWRNEPGAVAASLTGRAVGEEEHRSWYARALADPARMLRVVEDSGRPAGSIRLDRDDEDPQAAEVSLALDPAARGAGLAAPALELVARAAAEARFARSLVARVRPENQPSLAAFTSAGYEREGATADGVITLRRAVP